MDFYFCSIEFDKLNKIEIFIIFCYYLYYFEYFFLFLEKKLSAIINISLV